MEEARREIPFFRPSIGPAEIAEVVDSLSSGWLTTGPKTKQFEAEFSRYVGAGHAIALSSGTAGIAIALDALGVGPGDEVILPSLTFVACANEVVHRGARPVLVEVNDDFNIDPNAVETAITRRTRALMIVHYGGQAANLAALYAIAARHDLAVLEDAAHAAGTTYRGAKIGADALPNAAGLPNGGALRRATVFSFYATKNLTTGEGGMLTTNDDALAERMRLLSLHGMSRDAWKRYTSEGSWFYDVVAIGYKANLPDPLAALGLHQLRRLDDFTNTRRAYAKILDDRLASVAQVEAPIVHGEAGHVYHLYVIRLVLERLTIDRARFIDELRNHGISASVHFIPVHFHSIYRERFGYAPEDLPRTAALYRRIISLPLYPSMSIDDVRYVSDAVAEIASRHATP
ncbi:MAG: DegT/DnrJ/EryC1/StrS aminotransferase family protein [Chloroflexota bacterium]|nr:MAG: DegT/DnrJ/EryC1/StrS aminotransferase family protein [Chloroflexota bacterium]